MPPREPFTDVQTRKPWWLWPLIGGLAILAWAAFVSQILLGTDVGPNPAPDLALWIILALVGVGLPALVAGLRLEFVVDDASILCRYRPLMRRRIPLDRVRAAEARTYRPILEYGGWGVRWWPGHGWVYSIAGNTGVQLVLDDGKRILLGTDNAEALAAAINVRRSEPRA